MAQHSRAALRLHGTRCNHGRQCAAQRLSTPISPAPRAAFSLGTCVPGDFRSTLAQNQARRQQRQPALAGPLRLFPERDRIDRAGRWAYSEMPLNPCQEICYSQLKGSLPAVAGRSPSVIRIPHSAFGFSPSSSRPKQKSRRGIRPPRRLLETKFSS